MTIFLLVLILAAVGLVFFGIAGGSLLYKSLFLRKPEGRGALQAENRFVDRRLVAHIVDERLMGPLSAAKERWKALPLENVFITSHDGIPLAGYIWHAGNGDDAGGSGAGASVAFLVHGYTDSAAGMAFLAEEYHRRGFTVFAPDCRAHGNSGGTKIGMGCADSTDIAAWMDFLEKRFGPGMRVILHGTSMGAAASLLYGGSGQVSPAVKCIVSDSSFSSYYAECSYQLSCIVSGRWLQKVFRTSLIGGASLVCRIRSGVFFGKIAPVKAARYITVPLLFFHGEKDVLVPPQMSGDLYGAAAVKEKRLITVPGAPHMGSWFYDPVRYFEAVDLLWKDSVEGF